MAFRQITLQSPLVFLLLGLLLEVDKPFTTIFLQRKEQVREGRLLKQWNHTLIALVPKSDHAPMVQDYRPISCCMVFYKVISKILAGGHDLYIGSGAGDFHTGSIHW